MQEIIEALETQIKNATRERDSHLSSQRSYESEAEHSAHAAAKYQRLIDQAETVITQLKKETTR